MDEVQNRYESSKKKLNKDSLILIEELRFFQVKIKNRLEVLLINFDTNYLSLHLN